MILEDLARYLHDSGVGRLSTGPDNTIFIQHLPATPAEAIMVGEFPMGQGDLGLPYTVSRIDVVTRGVDLESTHRRAYKIAELLHGVHNTKLDPNGHYIVKIEGTNSIPEYVGQDPGGRHVYTQGFDIEYRRNV